MLLRLLLLLLLLLRLLLLLLLLLLLPPLLLLLLLLPPPPPPQLLLPPPLLLLLLPLLLRFTQILASAGRNDLPSCRCPRRHRDPCCQAADRKISQPALVAVSTAASLPAVLLKQTSSSTPNRKRGALRCQALGFRARARVVRLPHGTVRPLFAAGWRVWGTPEFVMFAYVCKWIFNPC